MLKDGAGDFNAPVDRQLYPHYYKAVRAPPCAHTPRPPAPLAFIAPNSSSMHRDHI
jgi:hypothetical protein